jgi:ribosomal protein S18 acetylase RimI-like enzyme
MITVRSMHQHDVDHVLPLMRELAVYQGIEDRYQPNPDRLRLQLGIGNPRIHGCIALEDAVAIGYCLFYLTDYSSFLSRWRALHLEDWFVQQHKRGQGIGTRLWQQVMNFAEHHTVERVTFDVHTDNFLAKQYYQRNGAVIPSPSEWERLYVPVA